MDGGGIIFKATNNDLILIMNEKDSIETICEQVEKKLKAAGKFFKGVSLSVKYRGKKLLPEEKDRLCRLMEEHTEAQITSFEEDTEYVSEYSNQDSASGRSNRAEEDDRGEIGDLYIKKFYFKGIDEGITKFYRGTVRSGQLISFDGNLVILGDVNPGAEIQATGNVIVIGALKGTVHAGMDGNKQAIIVALGIQPVQLRIADIITRPPDDTENIRESKNSFVPEIAYIKDDLIYIERFLPQR